MGTRQGYSLTLSFSIIPRVLGSIIRQEKELNGLKTGKEEVKLSLFTGTMIVYVGNLKSSTKKLLELINEFDKVAGHKLSK